VFGPLFRRWEVLIAYGTVEHAQLGVLSLSVCRQVAEVRELLTTTLGVTFVFLWKVDGLAVPSKQQVRGKGLAACLTRIRACPLMGLLVLLQQLLSFETSITSGEAASIR